VYENNKSIDMNILSFFSDGTTDADGKPALSVMRLIFAFAAGLIITAFVVVWSVLSIKQNDLLYPNVILGILGIIFGGKNIQNVLEYFSGKPKTDELSKPFSAQIGATAVQPLKPWPAPAPAEIRATVKSDVSTPQTGAVDQLGVIWFGAFVFVALLLFAILPGCSTKLESGGVYAPVTTNSSGVVTTNADMAFYAVEKTFWTTYQVLDAAFAAERDNRALYWSISPDIKHSLDKLRPQAWDVVTRYIAARRAYEAAPSTGNLTTLQGILDEVTKLSVSASAALAPVTTATLVNTNH
jgi:xanthosine utilization system XapX-like protein